MKTLARALAIASLAGIGASPLAAQDVTGQWIAEIERSMRNENGNVSTGDKAKARFVLQQKGDSVTGTWQVIDAAATTGRTSPTRQLRGTISGNKASLSSEVEATVSINGEQSVRKLTIVYDFIVVGDKLEGTTTTRSANMTMPARPFSAVREKS
jgi:hypothetical protein